MRAAQAARFRYREAWKQPARMRAWDRGEMPDRPAHGQRFAYVAAFGIYTMAFLAVASPWLAEAAEVMMLVAAVALA